MAKDISEMTTDDPAEQISLETSLEFSIVKNKIENSTTVEIDPDIFLLALILQIIRQCCNQKEHCDQ